MIPKIPLCPPPKKNCPLHHYLSLSVHQIETFLTIFFAPHVTPDTKGNSKECKAKGVLPGASWCNHLQKSLVLAAPISCSYFNKHPNTEQSGIRMVIPRTQFVSGYQMVRISNVRDQTYLSGYFFG
jgi:hypothetical protein